MVIKLLPVGQRLKSINAIGAKPKHSDRSKPHSEQKISSYSIFNGNRPQHNIPISADFAKGHKLEKLILKETPITRRDLNKVIDTVNFNLSCYSTGALPASTNPDSTYRRFAWTRDMAIKAFAMHETGCSEDAISVVKNIAAFYSRTEERGRFTNFLWDPSPREKYIKAPFADIPQIRAWIHDDGRMEESPQGWQHNQLDAIGMWLWLTFKLANENSLNLAELENELHYIQGSNGEDKPDSIFSVGLTFLNRIQYWDQFDVGPWEDLRGYKRASSIGACLAAFKEAKKYFDNNPGSIKVWNEAILKKEIENAIFNGETALKIRIPEDGREAIETDTHPFQYHDAALILLLYPFNPGLSKVQEEAILKTILNHRIGEVGISRRDCDSYVGMNYPYYPDKEGIYSDISQEDYKPAEWSFDPLLAAYCYKRFVISDGKDEDAFYMADRFLKRSIAQITKINDSFYNHGVKRQISIPDGIVPEAYWFDTHENRWRSNENSPLLWAECNFALAITEAIPAIALWEKVQHGTGQAA